MRVCRTCLRESLETNLYSIDEILKENSEISTDSDTLKLRKMIEKCIPEMDLDTCDNSVICEKCCLLLKNAYKFRNICLPTEEKIYQYMEKNNLRLGESIDLNNVSEKRLFKQEQEEISIDETDIKQENDISVEPDDDMPVLHPEIEIKREHHEKQLIIKLSPVSHSVEKNLETKRKRKRKQKQINKMTKTTYEQRPFACTRCQYRTVKLILLKGHLERCSGGKVLKCDQCSYSSLKSNHFNRHKRSHANSTIRKKEDNNTERFVCYVCKHIYTDKNDLRVHMLKHRPVIKCKEKGCEYSTRRPQYLSAHMVKHTKTYFCRVCGKWSHTNKNAIQEHEKNCEVAKNENTISYSDGQRIANNFQEET